MTPIKLAISAMGLDYAGSGTINYGLHGLCLPRWPHRKIRGAPLFHLGSHSYTALS